MNLNSFVTRLWVGYCKKSLGNEETYISLFYIKFTYNIYMVKCKNTVYLCDILRSVIRILHNFLVLQSTLMKLQCGHCEHYLYITVHTIQYMQRAVRAEQHDVDHTSVLG